MWKLMAGIRKEKPFHHKDIGKDLILTRSLRRDSTLQFICLVLHIGLLIWKMQGAQKKLYGALLMGNCREYLAGARNSFRHNKHLTILVAYYFAFGLAVVKLPFPSDGVEGWF